MSRFARAFGYFSLGLGISLLIGYWLKQEEQRNRQRSAMPHPQPLPPVPEEPVIVLSKKTLDAAEPPPPVIEKKKPQTSQTDDLTRIKGIGEKTAEALHAVGIQSYAGLAATDPATLLEQLQGVRGINLEKIKTWIAEATHLSHD